MIGRVLVVGSINIDLVARVARHPARGETVAARSLDHVPGGKGTNQAVAASRLGAATLLVACLGEDASATLLRDFLATTSIDTTAIATVAGPTGMALVTVDADGANSIVVSAGANASLTPEHVAAAGMSARDIVVTQREVPDATVAYTLRCAHEVGARSVFNPSPADGVDHLLLDLADVIVVNEHELAQLTGVASSALDDVSRPSTSAVTLERLRTRADQLLVATLGAHGAIVSAPDNDDIAHLTAETITVLDTTGAGDCFLGALAAGLAGGSSALEAARVAVAAAGYSVRHAGAATSMPFFEDLGDALPPAVPPNGVDGKRRATPASGNSTTSG